MSSQPSLGRDHTTYLECFPLGGCTGLLECRPGGAVSDKMRVGDDPSAGITSDPVGVGVMDVTPGEMISDSVGVRMIDVNPEGMISDSVGVGMIDVTPEGMISDSVEVGMIGRSTAEIIPEGGLLTVTVESVGGEGEKGVLVELGAAIGLVSGERRDEFWDDETGTKPGMSIGKHFASSGLLRLYFCKGLN